MPTKYYRKEIPTTPVYIDGVPFKFDILRTEDPMLIAALDKCIKDQVGGVISITQAEYDDEAKKKATGQPSNYGSSPRGQRSELSAVHGRAAGGAEEFDRVPALDQTPAPGLPGVSSVTGRPDPQPILVPSPAKMASVMSAVPKTANVKRN